MKKVLQIALLLVFVIVVAVWLFRNYSPYQICLRHSQAEATDSGMALESAQQYAEGLCRSKLPLRN